jgi:excisionase family DNA binding protein
MTPSALEVARVLTPESDAHMPDSWMTVREASVEWRVHPNTIYRHLTAGTLPCRVRKVGRVWRLNAADVHAVRDQFTAVMAEAEADPEGDR